MNAAKKRWTVFALAMVVGLALGFAAWEATSVQADINLDQPVSFPQVAHGLVVGEKLRTILVNRGTTPISARVSVLDADGGVVQQETLVVAPGAMQTSEFSCAAAAAPCPEPVLLSVGDPRSRLLRTEVTVRLVDVPRLFMAGAVVKDSDGSSTSVARLIANHNETLLRDVAPKE